MELNVEHMNKLETESNVVGMCDIVVNQEIVLKPGACIFIRGRSLRSKISRWVFLRSQWNHVYVAISSDTVADLSYQGVRIHPFSSLSDKDIVVIEPAWFSYEETTSVLGLIARVAVWQRIHTRFSWKEYWLRALGFVRKERRTDQLCHFWAETFLHNFIPPSERGKGLPDLLDILVNDYTSRQLKARYNLVKVYDYRGKV